MEIREELKYVKSHEWVKEEDGVAVIGLTDYAQSELGDLVLVNTSNGKLNDLVSSGLIMELYRPDGWKRYCGKLRRGY